MWRSKRLHELEQLDKKETSLERMLMALPIVLATPGVRNSEHRSSIKGRYWHFIDNLKPEHRENRRIFHPDRPSPGPARPKGLD